MSHISPPPRNQLTALAPDPETLSPRGRRAWTERMAVRRLDFTRYAVDSESGNQYVVVPEQHRCDCPDNRIRGETCKHLRRVALEITAGRVLPPGVAAECVSCGKPRHQERPLCTACAFDTGAIVLDRETGDRLVVVGTRPERADELTISATQTTVADYPANAGYPSDDAVIEVVYATAIARSDEPRRYLFPHSRLARTDDAEVVA